MNRRPAYASLTAYQRLWTYNIHQLNDQYIHDGLFRLLVSFVLNVCDWKTCKFEAE